MLNNKWMQNKTGFSLVVIVILIFAVGAMRFSRSCKSTAPILNQGVQKEIAADAPLTFTTHARCRMECRHISEENIREVLREGRINYEKSYNGKGKCPVFAIEDAMQDGTQLRIVFAKCVAEVKVVTCIDMTHEYDCDCGKETSGAERP